MRRKETQKISDILKQFEKSKIVRLEAKYIFIEDFDAMINLAKTNSFE